jgi:alkylhydroperoxidase family enzyme
MQPISMSPKGDTPFQRLLGYNDSILQSWNHLEESFFLSQTLSHELKEEIRRVLAYLNECEYCMAKGKPSEILTDEKIQKSVDFAKLIWKNNQEITKEFFMDLKLHFNDAEISELCAYICFISASQKFGTVLNLKPSCEI